MNKRERHDFRMGSRWKSFRAKVKKACYSQDVLTNEPLKRTWNCHHLDNRYWHYDDLSDINKFVALNEDSHSAVHWLYRYWRRDKSSFFVRVSHMLRQMAHYSNDYMFAQEKMLYKNKKTGKLYTLQSRALDCTNIRDGTTVIVYTDGQMVFVREASEFYEKFEEVGDGTV